MTYQLVDNADKVVLQTSTAHAMAWNLRSYINADVDDILIWMYEWFEHEGKMFKVEKTD